MAHLHVGSLIHLRARDYDPATGTFLSPDPLDGVDGTTTVANPYHYADNDPINQNDPTGLRPGENDCASALVRIVCEHQQQIIDVTATVAAGLVCGALAAPAGPFAAGAAASVCGGAVHRALSASYQGDNPWSAALNPEAVVGDAVVGGLTGAVAAKVFEWARPLLGKAIGRLAPRPGSVMNPQPGYNAVEAGGARFVASRGGVADLLGGAPDAVVLGHFPAYLEFAARTGARTFSMSDEAWNAMSAREQWVRNTRFLDRAIERGSKIRLATPIEIARPGSFYERELQYLFKRGYSPNADGTMLIQGWA